MIIYSFIFMQFKMNFFEKFLVKWKIKEVIHEMTRLDRITKFLSLIKNVLLIYK